jgi:hypothetical protein
MWFHLGKNEEITIIQHQMNCTLADQHELNNTQINIDYTTPN